MIHSLGLGKSGVFLLEGRFCDSVHGVGMGRRCTTADEVKSFWLDSLKGNSDEVLIEFPVQGHLLKLSARQHQPVADMLEPSFRSNFFVGTSYTAFPTAGFVCSSQCFAVHWQ